MTNQGNLYYLQKSRDKLKAKGGGHKKRRGPIGILSFDRELTPEEAERLTKEWKRATNKTAIVTGGTYTRLR